MHDRDRLEIHKINENLFNFLCFQRKITFSSVRSRKIVRKKCLVEKNSKTN